MNGLFDSIAIRKGAHSICQEDRENPWRKRSRQNRRKELEAVSDLIEDAGLAPEEVTEVLQQYIENRSANAS